MSINAVREVSKAAVQLTAAVLFMMLILDAPWGRAFLDYEPFTKVVGTFFFSGMHQSLSVPGMSISIFELAGMVLMIWCFLEHRSQSGKHAFTPLALVSLWCFPAMILVGVVSGVIHGNDPGVMMTQTRSILSLPIWFVIGYCLVHNTQRTWQIYAVFVLAMFLKSIQAIWYYVYVLGGKRGDAEYIVEHVTSDFLTTAMIVVIGFIFYRSSSWKKMLMYGIPVISACLLVFLLNDRRAALVGAAFGVGTLLAAARGKLFLRVMLYSFLGSLLLVVYLAATWNVSGPLGFPAKTIQSLTDPEESSAGYRMIENANLLMSVSSEPLLGLGFGRRFPIIFPLPNISGIYAEFDLWPHNTALYVWTFAGPLGFAFFGAFFCLNIAIGLRHCRQPRQSREMIILGAVAVAVVVKSLVYIYADLGLREVRLLAEMGFITGGLQRLIASCSQGQIASQPREVQYELVG